MIFKKAQLADTLHWIPAVIIIFLIIILFLFFAGIMTGERIIKGNKNVLNTNLAQGALNSYFELKNFLEAPVGNGQNIMKDYVFLWAMSVRERNPDSKKLEGFIDNWAKQTFFGGELILEYGGVKIIKQLNGRLKENAEIKIPFLDSSISVKIEKMSEEDEASRKIGEAFSELGNVGGI